ncbi:DUF1963 domain-containing protein [Rhizobium bangladeshense]|uniref:DUF1963 domain-containing protein n=1 Tax=Rhizobium bangladeshense TaxID=1138189 RepID=UPI0009ED5657
MRNPFRREPSSATTGALAYGDENFLKLEQFRIDARIAKRVPPVQGEAGHGWYGGEPRMPSYFSWPVGPDGEPLIFVAQLDCRAFPAGLWGGAPGILQCADVLQRPRSEEISPGECIARVRIRSRTTL